MAREYERNLKYKDFSKPCVYEDVIKIYKQAKEKLQSVGWNDQAETLAASILHYRNKLEQDTRLRELEKAKQVEKEKEKLELLQIVKMQKMKKERGRDLKQKELYEEELQEKQIKILMDKGFQLMDQAKLKFRNNQFDESIKLYEESKEIFEEINYTRGINLVSDSLISIQNEKKVYEARIKEVQETEEKEREMKREMEEKYKELLEEEKLKQKEKLAMLADKKEKEKKLAEKAYKLIDTATNLVMKEKFDDAYAQYMEARQIFIDLGWKNEVIKLDDENLYYLKQKRDEVEEREKRLKKLSLEKKREEELILESEKLQAELEKSSTAELRRKLLEKEQAKTKAKSREEETYQALDDVNELINRNRFNSAARILRRIYSEFIKSGWEKEAQKINSKLNEISKKCKIPLIQEETEIEIEDYSQKVEKTYELLDEAERSSQRARHMRVVSLLVELKEILEELQWNNSLKIIEEQIEIYKTYIKEKREKKEAKVISEVLTGAENSDIAFEFMDKCKRAERRNKYTVAIQYAQKAHQIFINLGKDWEREASRVLQYVDKLKSIQKERTTFIDKAKKEKMKETEKESKRELRRKEKKKRRIKKKIRKIKKQIRLITKCNLFERKKIYYKTYRFLSELNNKNKLL
jgi:hypothetical protein